MAAALAWPAESPAEDCVAGTPRGGGPTRLDESTRAKAGPDNAVLGCISRRRHRRGRDAGPAGSTPEPSQGSTAPRTEALQRKSRGRPYSGVVRATVGECRRRKNWQSVQESDDSVLRVRRGSCEGNLGTRLPIRVRQLSYRLPARSRGRRNVGLRAGASVFA